MEDGNTKVNTLDNKESEPRSDLEGGIPFDSRRMTFTLTQEQFEKLYLTPGGTQSKGDYHKRFGNPTPLGLLSFLICLTTFSADLLGFSHANSSESPLVMIGAMYFVAGIALWVTCILEWILGNTFISTVFGSFGSFWLSFAFLLQPMQGIAASFAQGAADPAYNAGIGLYMTFWAIAILIYSIASLRTNVVFAFLFWAVDIGFFVIAGAYFVTANGDATTAGHLLKAGGALCFASAISGWYMWFVLILATTGVPANLPVGDLSNFLSKK